MTTLTPFADDAASVSIGNLTIENGADQIALYGSLDITRDQRGLAQTRALQAVLDQAVRVLEGKKALPAELAPTAVKTVKNLLSRMTCLGDTGGSEGSLKPKEGLGGDAGHEC